MKKFTPEEDQFLKDHYLTIPAKRMSRMLKRSESASRQRMKVLGIVVPEEVIQKFKADSYIKKGTPAPNKGLRQEDFMDRDAIERVRKTCFKKGHKPDNTLFDQAITIRVDNAGRLYKWIRIAENKWEPLHVYNWKKSGKEIPKGYVLRFKNGDTLRPEVENLELISRLQLLILNRTVNKREKKPTKTKAFVAAGKKRREKVLKREQIQQEKLRQQAELKKKQEAKERLIALEQQRALMRKKEREPLFKTRSLDFSQMVSIRIDHKTIIYAKPGQDPDEVKQRYLSNLKKAG